MKKNKGVIAFTIIGILMSGYVSRVCATGNDVKFWDDSSINNKKTKKAFLECKYDAEKIGHVPDEKEVLSFNVEEEVSKSRRERISMQKQAGTYAETPEAELRNMDADINDSVRAMERHVTNLEKLARARLLIKACMTSKGFDL